MKQAKRYNPEEYQKNKEKLMENQRRYRNKPEVRERYLHKAREKSKEWYSKPENRKRRYEYNKQWWKNKVKEMEALAGRKRPEVCEICGQKDTIVFDHCHRNGHFRGWICKRCNTVLGKVNDNIDLLQKLIKYLRVK